jgi:hypothetical protein
MIAELTTDHMIDIEPQDEAMDMFRRNFRLVAGCRVSADGNKMRYSLKTEKGAQDWLSKAEGIIQSHNMPLEADIKVKKEKGRVIDVYLTINYKP